MHFLLNYRTTFRSAAVISLLMVVCGCGGETDPNRKPTYPVSGKVTLEGKPVADATLTFSPEEGQPVATGRTDAEGRYTLTTYEPDDGAAEGKYLVLVSKIDESKMPQVPTDPDDPAWQTINMAEVEKAQAAASVLADKYRMRGQSGLDANVTADGENVFDFGLQPK